MVPNLQPSFSPKVFLEPAVILIACPWVQAGQGREHLGCQPVLQPSLHPSLGEKLTPVPQLSQSL